MIGTGQRRKTDAIDIIAPEREARHRPVLRLVPPSEIVDAEFEDVAQPICPTPQYRDYAEPARRDAPPHRTELFAARRALALPALQANSAGFAALVATLCVASFLVFGGYALF